MEALVPTARLLLLSALLATTTSFLAVDNCHAQPNRQAGFAVVELFTSQGCSSCPPADRVLAKLKQRAAEEGLTVFPLSMHVDYWNRLGWADPYSSPGFTRRQQTYAAAAGESRVYTPQMIVNGSVGFVGSDRKLAARAVENALATAPTATLDITSNRSTDGRSIVVRYRVSGADAESQIVACLVRDAPPNEVPRGENAGRTLSHQNVVLALEAADLATDGLGSLTIRAPDRGPFEVIAFVQQRHSRAILAAARAAASRAAASR